MSALPRPRLTGPARALNDALHELHHRAGWPSLRALARETGVSHTTVSKTFSAPALPTWGTLELLVEAMDGSTDDFHRLWLAASSRTDGDGPTRSSGIAGRRTELDVVRRHLEAGTGLLLVTGEAGIGKTRLLTTAAEQVDCVVACATGQPLLRGEPFALVSEVLRRCLTTDQRWFKEALSDIPPYGEAALARILPELGPTTPSQHDDQFSTIKMLAALGSVVRALGSLRGLAIVVDDVQWADEASLTYLQLHLEAKNGVPVVAALRTDETDPEQQEWDERLQRQAGARLELAPLTREETCEQLTLLRGETPDQEEVGRLHHLSAGLPLFVADLATWDGHVLPRRLADSFEARFRRLPQEAFDLLALVAVADRPLPVDVLLDLTGLDLERLTILLRELDSARMLGRASASDVVLRHPLLAEAARARLVPGESESLHRRLARCLAGAPEHSAAEVAEHWRHAAAVDEELAWRVRAARVASGRLAPTEAAAHWLRARDLWTLRTAPDPGVTRAELVLESIRALALTGREDETSDLVAEALALAPTMPTAQRAVAMRRGSQALKDARPATGVAFAVNAQRAYEALGDIRGLISALGDESCALRGAGKFDEAEPVVARALALAREQGDVSALRDVLIEKAWLDVVSGRPDDGRAAAEEASGLVVVDQPFGDVWFSAYYTDLLLVVGAAADRVAAAAAPGLRSAQESGLQAWTLSTLIVANVAEAHLAGGLVAAAAAQIDPVTDDPPTYTTRYLHLTRANVDIARGRLEQAGSLLDVVETLLGTTVYSHEVGLLLGRASCECWSGRPEDWWQRALHYFDSPRTTSWSPYTGTLLQLTARAAADLAATGDADPGRLIETLRDMHRAVAPDPFLSTAPARIAAATGATWQAELARVAHRDTSDGWARAVGLWDEVRRPHDAAYCRWRAAQCALRVTQGGVAARLLKRAATDAREHVPLSRAIAEISSR